VGRKGRKGGETVEERDGPRGDVKRAEEENEGVGYLICPSRPFSSHPPILIPYNVMAEAPQYMG
jgi:hypothetical protein